jgi:hypothetical protein
VVKAVASLAPPEYERSPVVTSFSPFEVWMRALLEGHRIDAGLDHCKPPHQGACCFFGPFT